MTTQTPNLHLVKESGNERPQRANWNGNMDKIDAAVGAVDVENDGSLAEQVDDVRQSVSLVQFMNNAQELRINDWGAGANIYIVSDANADSGFGMNINDNGSITFWKRRNGVATTLKTI